MKNRSAYRNCIIAGLAAALLLAPFARWYSIGVGVVVWYQYAMLVGEIDDERKSRRDLAWLGVVRTAIVFAVMFLAVAAACIR